MIRSDLIQYYDAIKEKPITDPEFPEPLKLVPIEFKKALKRYYSEYFSPRALLKVIGLNSFDFREFGFIYDIPTKPKEKMPFDRNLNFETPTLLKNYLETSPPAHAYVGAVYKRHLTRGHGVLMGDVVRRELCFDIDITDFDMIREKICKCSEKQICNLCLDLTKEAALFVIDTLRDDFGFKKFAIVFSGGGGFHIWVKDEPAEMLARALLPEIKLHNTIRFEKDLRLSIVNYLSPIEVTKRKKLVLRDTVIRSHSLRKRILSTVLYNFLLKTPLEVIQKSGLDIEDITRIRAKIAQDGYTPEIYDWIINSKFRNTTSKMNFDATFLKYRYPRYDKSPTQDIVRVLRVPDSIHGKTGNLCTIVKDLSTFTLANIPTIWNYVK